MKMFLKTISVTLPILALLIIFIPVQTIGEYIALNVAGIIMTIVAMILGIKYMSATSEDKADIKQTLPAYIISCIVVFGAFTIWKVLINIIQ